MVKSYKDWEQKTDIKLFMMKPTITTYKIFYLKIIILNVLLVKDENVWL